MQSVLPKATHHGAIRLGDIALDCFVLGDGRRLLSQRSVLRAIHAAEQNKFERQIAGIVKDSSELTLAAEVEFELPQGGITGIGREPSFLIGLCRAYQRKLLAGELRSNQRHLGVAACELLGGLAGVGLEALIDDACSYHPKESRQDALDRWIRDSRNFGVDRILDDEFLDDYCRLYNKRHNPGRPPPRLVIGMSGKFYAEVMGGEVHASLKDACSGDTRRRDGRRAEMYQRLTDTALAFLQTNILIAKGIVRQVRTPDEFWRRLRVALRRDEGFQLSLLG